MAATESKRKIKIVSAALAAALALALLPGGALADTDDPARVLVLYNTTSNYNTESNGNGMRDSYELALAYAVKRGVPMENLLGLNINNSNAFYYPATQEGCAQFLSDVINPVKARLNELGPNNIDYIAVSVGVPYQVSDILSLDSYLVTPFNVSSDCSRNSTYNPFFEYSPTVGVDKGHYDHTYTVIGGSSMYPVSRFIRLPAGDLPGVDELKGTIYGALYGEKYLYNAEGYYRGIGYVDGRDKQQNSGKVWSDADLAGYPFGMGTYAGMDKTIVYTHKFFELLDYPYKREVTDYEIGEQGAEYIDGTPASSADGAMFYAGWYNYNKYRDSYRWLPGSAACELNSNSDSFLTSAMEKGLTSGVGVIDEPGGSGGGHPYPDVFIYYMMNGYNLAESGWHSIPTFKSRSILFGDPLYNPMKQKNPAKDTAFDRELIVFDEAMPGITAEKRKVKVFLAEGPEPEMAVFKLDYGTTQALGNTIDYNHVYRYAGDFNIENLSADTKYYYQVTAKDPAGNIKESQLLEFTTAQNNAASIFSLALSYDKNFVAPGQTINFSSSSNCQNCTYTWNFGDGAQASGQSASHQYSDNGTYDVFLVAKDSGSISKAARGIVFAYSNQGCESGQTRGCQKQSGVCAGSTQTCQSGAWPGCSATAYHDWNGGYEQAETACGDKLDNDCDGYKDCLDTDCSSSADCAKCGNGQIDPEENCTTCPQDVQCPEGRQCQSGQCIQTYCVDMAALMNYIGQWKRGEITMATLMGKILKWKTGEGCIGRGITGF